MSKPREPNLFHVGLDSVSDQRSVGGLSGPIRQNAGRRDWSKVSIASWSDQKTRESMARSDPSKRRPEELVYGGRKRWSDQKTRG